MQKIISQICNHLTDLQLSRTRSTPLGYREPWCHQFDNRALDERGRGTTP